MRFVDDQDFASTDVSSDEQPGHNLKKATSGRGINEGVR